MATTKIWSVRGRLDNVLSYAANPEKTANPAFGREDLQSLRDVMNYAVDDFKTEQQLYVTGINCVSEFAREQMQETKRRWHKEGGIIAFHGYQSFAAGEVTPEQAHKIGVELAKQLWGDRFEVIVATHLNTGHLHNHFVLNSVSFMDGKKFYANRASYRRMRKTSDDLCRQNSLSVIEHPKQGRGKDRTEWQAEQDGKPTVRGFIRADIDAAIAASTTAHQFWREMERRGYTLKLNGVKHPAIRPPGHAHFFRLSGLGDAYTIEAIRTRILRNHTRTATMQPTTERRRIYGRLRSTFKKGKRLTGLRALYFRYLYMLGILPRNRPNNRRTHAVLREDIIKMDRIAAQTKLLWEYRIDTKQQLSDFCITVQEQQKADTAEREALRNELRRLRRAKPPDPDKIEEVKNKITGLSKALAKRRRQLSLCDEIAARSADVAVKLREAEREEHEQNQNVKEGTPHERSR